MIEIFENFLSNEELEEHFSLLKESQRWAFTGFSPDESERHLEENYTFWYNPLNDIPFYTEYLFNKIVKETKKEFVLENVYANGQTYGLPGNFHIDATDNDYYTFIIYMNPVWDLCWGGQTIFLFEKQNEEFVLTPEPGSGVLFKGNVPHVGLEPTRYFKDIRITVAFKMKHVI